MNSIETVTKNSNVVVLDECLRSGRIECTIKCITVNTGMQKYVDIRALALREPTDTSDETTKLELGTRIKFDASLVSQYSDEFQLNTFVIDSMFFHLRKDEREDSFVDIRTCLTLYDEGRRIRVLQNQEVHFDGEVIGYLEFVGVDEDNDGWWSLSDPDHSHIPLTDYELGQISNKKTIQEIGRYLDDRFKDWNV